MASVLLLQRDCVLMKLLLMLILIRSGRAHNECYENLSCYTQAGAYKSYVPNLLQI